MQPPPLLRPPVKFVEFPRDVITLISKHLPPQDLQNLARTSIRIKGIVKEELDHYKRSMISLLHNLLIDLRYHINYHNLPSLEVIRKVEAALRDNTSFEASFDLSRPVGILGYFQQKLSSGGFIEAPLIDQIKYSLNDICRGSPGRKRVYLCSTAAPYDNYLEFSRHRIQSANPSLVKFFCGNTAIDREKFAELAATNVEQVVLLRGLFDNHELYSDLVRFAENSTLTDTLAISGHEGTYTPLVQNLISVIEKFSSLKRLTLTNFSLTDENLETLRELFYLRATKSEFKAVFIKNCQISDNVRHFLETTCPNALDTRTTIFNFSELKNPA